MNVKYSQYSAFSIIEVLIGIFVFSLGLVSIFAILASSLSINERNKNSIIASNLAREQIELLRNIRDTNYENVQVWNQKDPINGSSIDLFTSWNYYTLENKFSWAWSSTAFLPISWFEEWEDKLAQMQRYRLCLNSDNIYTYECSGANIETPFYRFLYVTDKVANDDGSDSAVVLPSWALRVVSKVIWVKRGYYEFDIQTIITDWRRI